MNNLRRFGATVLTVSALALGGLAASSSAGAQAVASLPVAIYQGTCDSETIQHVVDLEPIVPAASVAGATFGGSDLAIDVATSTTTLQGSFADVMANAPLAIIVASGTDANAVELSCGVIGGFVNGNQVAFGIDDVNNSGIAGVATIADLGTSVTVTVILGEFPVGEPTSGSAAAAGTDCVEEPVAQVTSPHGPPVAGDADGDNITDADEATLGTDPNNPDTDGDGQMDGLETGYSGTDPLDASSVALDTDGDGLPDDFELEIGADPSNPDSDNDGISDGWEFFLGNDPLNPEDPADAGADTLADADQDGLTTRTEIELGTDPANPDTDLDGVSDGAEVEAGTNPLIAGC